EIKRSNIEIRQLEDKLTEQNRTNKQQKIELQSLQAQYYSRNKALEDAQSELSLLTSRLSLDDTNVRKQQKIDRMTTQVSNQQAEMKKLSEKCGILGAENSRLSQQLDNITRQLHNTQQQKDIKGSELLQTRIKFLESELEEKDIQAEKANSHYKETESKLQEIKQELYFYQEHSSDLKSQVDQSEMGQQAIQSELIVKDGDIASYKTEIKHLEISNKQLETELNHHKCRIEELNTELRNVTNIKSLLENQLTQEKHSVEKEKSLNDKKKEEVHEAKQRVDAIKHEQTFLLTALQEERVDKQQLT
ncbi:hypothetical protein LOTGIDRAFT_176692, partial [Lottia gigantea]